MKYQLKLRPEASADVAEAFSWYEEQRPGLGVEFEDELHRTFGYIRDMPLASRLMHQSVRRALVHRFPFSVYYSVTDDLIEIRAVLHYRRRPRTWRRRA
ncbi:MAG TPA: type II toxin-antitoxin system RelE/ParE family toxin [Gemmatimonadales bacterium]|nr:type II toxin-antitoxin system RelE/ParE family toxin [Gemmatimonadales bacterium]